jgi:hypothetical protein
MTSKIKKTCALAYGITTLIDLIFLLLSFDLFLGFDLTGGIESFICKLFQIYRGTSVLEINLKSYCGRWELRAYGFRNFENYRLRVKVLCS